MSYYQNVFEEFVGNLLLSDRQYSPSFKINGGRPNETKLMQAWNPQPFNLTGNKNLTINYSFDQGNTWTALTIDVSTSAASLSAALAGEVAAALNANATFQVLFTASTVSDAKNQNTYLQITSTRQRERFKVYISNGSAETILRFNKKAGVAQLPSYFTRHTIANKTVYPDSVGMLQLLDTSNARDQQIITEASQDYTTVFPDWFLMAGKTGLFNFQNITVDGNDRITQIIEYPAGAKQGDFARKINYTYTGTNTHPIKIVEQPYILSGNALSGTGDFVVP